MAEWGIPYSAENDAASSGKLKIAWVKVLCGDCETDTQLQNVQAERRTEGVSN